MSRRPLSVLVALILAIVSLGPPALAAEPDDGVTPHGPTERPDPDQALSQRDATTRTLPASNVGRGQLRNLAVAGRGERLLPEATTDVWAHDGYAYLGTFNDPCGTGTIDAAGVRIFDVSNPTNPVPIGSLPSVEGSRVNDVKVADLGGRSILVHSNEPCDGGRGGFEIYDVSDPTNAVLLASVQTDDINPLIREEGVVDVGVHNLFLWSRGGRDYVAANAETFFGNLQIFDITDPADPELVGWWGAEEIGFPGVDFTTLSDIPTIIAAEQYMLSGYGASANRFLHDFTVSADGSTLYYAGWDAGLVRLDITDPTDPQVVSVALDPTNGSPGDGEVNSHSVWPNADGTVVVEGEEDFSANERAAPLSNFTFGTNTTNTIPGVGISTLAGNDFEANQTGNTVTVTATSVTVNSGPLGGRVYPAVEGAGNQPRIADTGPITGEAVWIGRACTGDPILNAASIGSGDIAVVRRGACTFATKLANAAQAGASAIVIANNVSTVTPWGGLRIWDYSDPANPVLVSTFDTTCSLDPVKAACDPRGTYTVHNVVVEGNRAYVSWYSDGVLVLDISNPSQPREIARFNPTGTEFEAQNGGIQDVWGIWKIPNQPWIYASDRNGGLYVLKEFGQGSGRIGRP